MRTPRSDKLTNSRRYVDLSGSSADDLAERQTVRGTGRPSRAARIRRTLCWLFTLAVVMSLIVLGVLASQFRVPTVRVGSVQQVDSDEADAGISLDVASGVLSMNWIVELAFTNTWLLDISLHQLTASASFSFDPERTIATGSLPMVVLRARQNTTAQLPLRARIELKDTTTASAAAANAELLERIMACQTTKEQLHVDYDATAGVSILGIGPFKGPEVTGSFAVDCPQLPVALGDLIAVLGAGNGPTTLQAIGANLVRAHVSMEGAQ